MELKNHYAEVNPAGVCFAQLETSGEIDAPHMVPIAPGDNRLGQKWTGDAWEVIAPTAAELAAAELQTIDKATGMSRTMREAFIALGVKVGADVTYLQQQETKAAAARLKLK